MKQLDSVGLRFDNGKLWILDQTQLPHKECWLDGTLPSDMCQHLQLLRVRGAPLIGVAAAICLARFIEQGATKHEIQQAATLLRNARPTAVNLMWAIDRVVQADNPVAAAEAIFQEDVLLCEKLAEHGTALLADEEIIITHCNSGSLATAGIGTALGVIRRGFELGKIRHVYVDETRPLLQGARLTTWELNKLGIPHTLISDSMAAVLMQQQKITRVFVGADRIAVNGDSANKIGTYSLAIAANYHHIPFHVVAPYSTVDPACKEGKDIIIEERDPLELYDYLNEVTLPTHMSIFNPAFDVTPMTLINSIVLDKYVINHQNIQLLANN